MTISLPAAPSVAPPRVSSFPEFGSSAGAEAVELAASAGLFLDPWQAWVLEHALGERPDGKWAAFEVGLVVPRQNGKGSILEARELAGLFLFGERLILHSAHEFKTAAEAFNRVLALVQNTPELESRVAQVRTSHGDEGIKLKDGARLRFVARSTGSGRGFTGDCIILDEAYNLGPKAMAALLPTLSARPNPQLWYTSSAGMEESEQLRAVRERGTAGVGRLAYFEWSAEPDADLDDRGAWAQANPALDIRISEEFVEMERDAMPEVEFARERLGIWDDASGQQLIDPVAWMRLEDAASKIDGPMAFGYDVAQDRSAATIAVCGRRSDGSLHVALVEREAGTRWLITRLPELRERWSPTAIGLDPASNAGSVAPDFEDLGVELERLSSQKIAQACGGFYDDITEGRLHHLGDADLNGAVVAARAKPVGDAWRWKRTGDTDLSPLYAATIARYVFLVTEPPQGSAYEDREMVVL